MTKNRPSESSQGTKGLGSLSGVELLMGQLRVREARKREGYRVTEQRDAYYRLVELEHDWKCSLWRSGRGRRVYRKFFAFVKQRLRSVLEARPYFRERDGVFRATFGPALRRGDVDVVAVASVNYQFIKWAHRAVSFPPHSRLALLYEELVKVRRDHAELFIPLLYSRAVRFLKSIPEVTTLADLVGDSGEGIMQGLDKYVQPWRPVIRSVVMGRSKAIWISTSSATDVAMPPSDKRQLYRVVKDQEDLRHVPTSAEVALLSARRASSMDSQVDLRGDGTNTATYHDILASPDVQKGPRRIDRVAAAAAKLSLFERKVLALSGLLSLDLILETETL